jgi:predicted  nucleic acid-binding Zn-ribbon protein
VETLKGIVYSMVALTNHAKRPFLSRHRMVNADELATLLTKVQSVIQSMEDTAQAIVPIDTEVSDKMLHDTRHEIVTVHKDMVRLKKEAHDYADGILSRLQLAITKLQQNVIRMEKNIAEGRKLIHEKQLSQMKGDTHET